MSQSHELAQTEVAYIEPTKAQTAEEVPPSSEGKARDKEDKTDPVSKISTSLSNIEKDVSSVEKKLPQRALGK